MFLFQNSTCFEQPRAHHQENQLYQYNTWYMSLCVGERLVCRSGRSSLQMLYWYNWFSWWWARCCSKRAENWNKRI